MYIFDKADSNLVSFKNCQFNSTCWSKYSHSHALSPVQISAREHFTGTIGNIQFEHCEVWDLENRYWLSAVAPKVHDISGSVTVHNPHPQKGCQARLTSGAHLDISVKCQGEGTPPKVASRGTLLI